jgi:hypothetical protein
LGADPLFVKLDRLVPVAVGADGERIPPLTGSTDVDVVGGLLAVNDFTGHSSILRPNIGSGKK